MHEHTIKALGCYDEVKELLTHVGLFYYAFNPLPSYHSLIVEFISSYTLRFVKYDEDNPYFSIRFKLGGKDRFMTSQEFNTLFGFTQECHVQVKANWRASTL